VSAAAGDVLRWAEIDVDTLASNAEVVAALVRPAAVMAMVKSNGYGHGMSIAARAALEGGATWLGVYLPQEALALRGAGFTTPILVVGWSPASILARLVAANVDITVFDADGIRSLATAAASTGKRACAHLKIDTGLRRLGALPESVDSLLGALREVEGRIELAGVFTHFADAGGDLDFTIAQHGRFLDAVEAVRAVAPHPLLHASGSAAILAHPAMHHDLVRLGIAFYGYPPVPGPASLRIAMHVFSRVA
jgi:alanine racemase